MRFPRLTPLAAALAAVALAAPSLAVGQTAADNMREAARKMRENVERLGPNLPADARAAMLKQADDLEAQAKDSAFNTPATPKPEPSLADKLMAEHGRLDWIATKAACAGYTVDNYRTFRFDPAINDRDSHCRNAYGHWATYLRLSRDPAAAEGAAQALFYYDAAARRALALVGS